jgi:hypothetical protein
MPTQLIIDLSNALAARAPQRVADTLQTILGVCRSRAIEEDWAAIRPLADAADDLLAAQSYPADESESALAALTSLGQQLCLILALVGDSNGVRDSGYFRASMAHAERLDAATGGNLRLVELVELIRG